MADATLTLEAKFIDHVTSSIRSISSQMEKMELTIHESTGQITKDIAKMNKEGRDGGDAFSGFATKIRNWAVGVGAAYVSWRAFTGLVTSSIAEAREAEQAQRDLAASIELSGRGASTSVESMYAFANSLAQVTDFQDDAIASAASLLLQFDHIGTEAIPQVTEMALNLSKKFGVDLSSAATLLGRALQDPEAGLNTLNRQFRLFSDAEEENIRQLVKHGNGMEAQGRIIAALEGRYKDFAKNTVDPLKKANNELNEAKEMIGKQLLPAVTSFTKYVAETAIPFWTELGGSIGRGIGRFLGGNEAIDQLQDKLQRLGAEAAAAKNKMGMGDVKAGDSSYARTEEPGKNFGGPTPEEIATAEQERFDAAAKVNEGERNRRYDEAVKERDRIRREKEWEVTEEETAEEKKFKAKEHYRTLINGINEEQIEAERQKIDISMQAAKASAQAVSMLAGKSKLAFGLSKAIAAAEIGISTARNITQQPGPFGGLIPFWIALGASQAAVVAASAVKGFALGTIAAPGGGAIVGENGPEFISNLPRGSRVYNNSETRSMFGGGGDIHAPFSVIIQGNASPATVDKIREVGDAYVEKLKELRRMNRDLTYLNIPDA